MTISYYEVNELRQRLIDRFTPEELIEALGVETGDVFDAFFDRCVEKNWEDVI